MLLSKKCLKIKVFVTVILIIGIVTICLLKLGRSVYDDVLRQNSKYFVSLKDIDSSRLPERIIFLWTPMFRNYDKWTWVVGSDPLMKDCNGNDVDGKCLITTHKSLLEKADVVLFSVQDIKKVWMFSICII